MAFNVRSVTASGNVVGSWHFDEGEGIIVYDSSGYLNDGTIHGATWTTYGAYGGALEFDGTDDYVEVPDSDSLDGRVR